MNQIIKNQVENDKQVTSLDLNEQIITNYLNRLKNPFVNLSVKDVSRDLHIGINQAYELFRQNNFPAIKVGKRKMVSLPAYLVWKMNSYKKGGDS